jgi:membrane protein implicated in regulation of membrane protease activity
VVSVLALGARSWVGLADWAAAGIIALWVIKDAVLYPFVRAAYRPDSEDGGSGMVGRPGVAPEGLRSSGYVRISSELWRAELRPGAEPVEPGGRVRVRAVRGLTLEVEPDDGES